MSRSVYVIGVGMTKFDKPGTKDGDYHDWAREAGTKALEDAGVAYDEVEQAYVGYVYGESCSGHRAVYELGLSGIPVFNVNSNCSTGSSALFLAAQAVRGRRLVRAGAGIRGDAAGVVGRDVHRSRAAVGQAHGAAGADLGGAASAGA